MPVTRITIHHEGPPGQPTNNVDRFKHGGYSCGIGIDRYEMFRSPYESWGTWGHNHTSFDICISGDRMKYPITDKELDLLNVACADARARKWVDSAATVYPHGVLHPVPPGYPVGNRQTECPGVETVERWPEIVNACSGLLLTTPPPTPEEDMTPAECHDVVLEILRSPEQAQRDRDRILEIVRSPEFKQIIHDASQ